MICTYISAYSLGELSIIITLIDKTILCCYIQEEQCSLGYNMYSAQIEGGGGAISLLINSRFWSLLWTISTQVSRLISGARIWRPVPLLVKL